MMARQDLDPVIAAPALFEVVAASASAPPPKSLSPQPRELSVLVVDDVPQICDFFRALVRRMRGLRLSIVTEVDSLRALERVKTEPFDVVVSDFRMREVDGIDVLEEALRSNPRGFRVLMTGYNEIPTPVARIRRAEVDAYVQKPLQMQEIQILLSAFASGDRTLLAEERAHARDLEAAAEHEEASA